RGEILALRWRSVDLDGKTLVVREAIEETREGRLFKEPKSKAGMRDIALPDIVVDTLPSAPAARTAACIGARQERRRHRSVSPRGRNAAVAPCTFQRVGCRCSGDGPARDQVSRLAPYSRFPPHRRRHRCGKDQQATWAWFAGDTLGIYAHLFNRRDDKSAA